MIEHTEFLKIHLLEWNAVIRANAEIVDVARDFARIFFGMAAILADRGSLV